jgi:N6-adenosine-specific RNA methylase IME4
MKYQIIYADPPWKYGGRSKNDLKRKSLEEFHPTLSFEELNCLEVQNITAKDCLLFLWVVSPEIKKCIKVGESWGFKYITIAFVWHQKIALLGNYTMAGCQLCLLFRKGKIPKGKLKGKGNGVKQFYEETITRTSQKPNEIRNRIKKLFPKSKRIEFFARQKTEGWDTIGYEVDGKDIRISLREIAENDKSL